MYKIISGKVIKGKALGAKLGFPTANIYLKDNDIEDATYKINVEVGGQIYRGVGAYLKRKNLFEANIFDFNKDIYGENIRIIVMYKIRDNRIFKNKEELREQVKLDVTKAKKQNDYVLTFGTFDLIHPGHSYYLNSAKFYGNKLVTIVATDKNVERFKGKLPVNGMEQRMQDVKNMRISDIVCKGEEISTIKWLEMYSPRVVCLGYDQEGFIGKLKERIKEKRLQIKIVRLHPYKENLFKSSIIKNKGSK